MEHRHAAADRARARVLSCATPFSALATAQTPSPADVAKKMVAASAAAAMLTLNPMAAVANEFDILSEPTPTTNYYVDDANVLSKSTRSEVNKKLRLLEVCRGGWGSGGVSVCVCWCACAHCLCMCMWLCRCIARACRRMHC